MSRFWAGFALASVVWGAAGAYLVLGLGYGPPLEVSEIPVSEAEPAAEPDEPVVERPRRRRGPRAARTRTPRGTVTTGDDLREGEPRMIDMAGSGGEAQLSAAQIEAGFDSAMGRIRRCLVLMAGDDPVSGRITFGLRVAPTGVVRAVSLTGPAAATTGEAGECLRGAARAIRFDAFDGPEMVVRYPLDLT